MLATLGIPMAWGSQPIVENQGCWGFCAWHLRIAWKRLVDQWGIRSVAAQHAAKPGGSLQPTFLDDFLNNF